MFRIRAATVRERCRPGLRHPSLTVGALIRPACVQRSLEHAIALASGGKRTISVMCDHIEPQVSQRVRFVVLQHTDRYGAHFDLMIDQGDYLATWKCPRPPEEAGAEGQSCMRIADHRRVYLDYEGAVSGSRGHVARHDAGVCVVCSRRDDQWEVEFHGERLAGRYMLIRQQAETPKRQNGETTRISLQKRNSAFGDGSQSSWLLRAQ